MNLDGNSWLVHYERLKQDFQGKRKVSNQLSGNVCQDFLGRIADLDRDLGVMRESPMQYDLWTSEIVRRQVILENLKRQVNVCNAGEANKNAPYTSNVASVTTAAGAYTSTTSASGASTVHNPLTTTDQGLIQRQREVIKMQDDMILDIEKGVEKLHNTALEIGKETKIQTKILDELDVHVDQATVGLRNETKHAEEVQRKSQTCYMYICIILEVIILIILVLILFVKV